MFLDVFLTEYDENLGSELNVDPLDMQVIWSAFGQQIFRNRVSSISNDVRNYTLNLFNHWLIRRLIEDDSIVLGKVLQKVYPSKRERDFKHACLVFLENLYVYSMIAHQDDKGVNTTGVLGISNARSRWEAASGNPALLFSHEKSAYVLVRQTLLGVSGRYKTPLVEMGFFDRHYQYDLPSAQPLWQQVDNLVAEVPVLRTLADALVTVLRELLAINDRQPQRTFTQIPEWVLQAIVNAFPSPAAVGSYACDFWLRVTDLDKGAAGALYRALKAMPQSDQVKSGVVERIFAAALNEGESGAERVKLEHIKSLEPFLGELDLLFTLMLSQRQQTPGDIVARWQALGRTPSTLALLAEPIETNAALFTPLSATGRARLQELIKLAHAVDMEPQILQLLAYHNNVMQSRGQLSWLKHGQNGSLILNVKARRAPAPGERPVGQWVNQYYIPQFRNLLNGLWGLNT